MRSEGSQHIYKWFSSAKKTEHGNRIMEEMGNLKGLEKDEVKNYVLIPIRTKDKEGKESTSSWSIHEIHKDGDVNYKLNDDEDRWSEEDNK